MKITLQTGKATSKYFEFNRSHVDAIGNYVGQLEPGIYQSLSARTYKMSYLIVTKCSNGNIAVVGIQSDSQALIPISIMNDSWNGFDWELCTEPITLTFSND